jgi:hypothetical protein
MKNKREIDQATVTNPYSRGGLLLRVETLEKVEIPLIEFPSNLRWLCLSFDVSVFLRLSLRGSL